jgi:hypothetical protein
MVLFGLKKNAQLVPNLGFPNLNWLREEKHILFEGSTPYQWRCFKIQGQNGWGVLSIHTYVFGGLKTK